MAIDDKQMIDFIGTDKKSGLTVLTISDHLPWDDEAFDVHLEVLTEKIDAYVGAIESGELCDSYVKGADGGIMIQLVCQYEPTKDALDHLKPITLQMEQLEIRFEWMVFEGD